MNECGTLQGKTRNQQIYDGKLCKMRDVESDLNKRLCF